MPGRGVLQTVELWEVDTGKHLGSIQRDEAVRGLAFADDRMLVGADYLSLFTLDVPAMTLIKSVPAHNIVTKSLQLSPDGRTAATTSLDQTVKLWSVPELALLHTLEGHSAGVKDAAVANGGQRALSTAGDGTIRLWDPAKAAPLKPAYTIREERAATGMEMQASRPPLVALCRSRNDNLLVANVETQAPPTLLKSRPYQITDADISLSGRYAATGREEGMMKYWDVEDGSCLFTAPKREGKQMAVAIARREHIVFTGHDDGSVLVWDVQTGEVLQEAAAHSASVFKMLSSPDARAIVSIDRPGKFGDALPHRAVFWNAEDFTRRFELAIPTGPTTCAAFSPDGGRLVTVDGDFSDTRIHIWDAANGDLLPLSFGTVRRSECVAFSAGGRWLFTDHCAIPQSTICLWEADTARPVARFFNNGITYAGFVPLAGGRLAAIEKSGRVAYFQLENDAQAEQTALEEEAFQQRALEAALFDPAEARRQAAAQHKQGSELFKVKQYKEALAAFSKALELTQMAARGGQHGSTSHIHDAIGLCRQQLGDAQGAIASFFESLREYEETPIKSELKAGRIAGVLHRLGTAYRATDPAQALVYFERSLAEREKVKDTSPQNQTAYENTKKAIAKLKESAGQGV